MSIALKLKRYNGNNYIPLEIIKILIHRIFIVYATKYLILPNHYNKKFENFMAIINSFPNYLIISTKYPSY